MTTSRLCVTVAVPDLEDLRRRRDQASRLADVVELRLDALGRPDVAGALDGRTGPVLVTCRPVWEGGWFQGSEEARLAILREAVERGAEYVDVEWKAAHGPLVAARGGRGIVLSSHDFERVPADLAERYKAMHATGAEVVKLAAHAGSLAECLALRAIGAEARKDGRLAAVVGMGPAAVATRILPGRFGSCWSYSGPAVAPGQLEPDVMLRDYRFREIAPTTRLFGVVGKPVGHSLSPAMHNAAFRACGIDAVYLPLEASDAQDFLTFAAEMGIEGASVTAPFKQALLHSAQLDAVSTEVGALNTLRRRDGRWEGRNTDVEGFLSPLRETDLRGARAAVLGTGGAARSVVAGLLDAGAEVTVYGRNRERAATAAAVAAGAASRVGVPPRGSWDLLVNTTPVGTAPEAQATPIAAEHLGGGLVYDLVYNPARTRLMREAEEAGCRTIGGLEMLVAQAVLQFEWWTGRPAPVSLMRESARARLQTMAGTE